jgi:flagella basal body P-ring formation protein FlgA
MKRTSTRKQEFMFTRVLLCCVLIVCTAVANEKVSVPNSEPGLQIYLPREVTIKDSTMKLGQIGIIRGPQALVTRASEVTLGRFSLQAQKIVIEKHIILSRLASNGISSSQVTLQGAEKVSVSRERKIISSADFVEMAAAYLENNLFDKSISGWNPIRRPKDLVIPEPQKDMKFVCRLVEGGARNQTKVEVEVFSGDKLLATREVIFTLKYNSRTAVALVDIPAGTIISRENVRIEQVSSNNPEPPGWKPPYGLIAKCALPAETVLKPYMFGSAESPVVIKRNQNVVIRIERPGFLITAVGKAMQDGKIGEYIKVRNIDSQRVILAKVNEDRSVEPII